MQFKADQFLEVVAQVKKNQAKNVLFSVILFAFYSFFIFRNTGGTFNKVFTLTELLFSVMLAGMFYSRVKSFGKTINNTASVITIIDNEVTIETFPFNFSFINKGEQKLSFNADEIFVKKVPYPISTPIKDSVLLFVVKDVNIFILPDYLPPDFTKTFLEAKKSTETLVGK